MGLLDSLGLDNVEADPNHLADGTYNGEIYKSDAVVSKKDDVFHVISYRVTEGPRKGAQKDEWFKLGHTPVRSDDPGKAVVGFTPSMTEQAKPWYKKRWVDLGVPEAEVSSSPFSRLVGTPVTFGIKTKDGFSNISFVNKRDDLAEPMNVSISTPGAL